ncbi:long-chain acyl-CoA synthase, putative [Plasmodium berghei]|uniref:Acyl-CoA synthetase, putative n=2 Tax=Plasmodium berghei TaxID=5821 RepID=A0A509AFV1_PLABA|nr:acyl-CoA synthetase, putative [Plasmodium berghei ANKA]CXH95792.1 long-chain acyl-CoA synthase, putative [Plasmodium berghei]SCL91061.1 long-chain acyl-CoA synthase, putative [Plasmodium berghei]SCM15416.1 long-chain acyl-CoA synthase, putative [Plasmodium berghei]SCM17211.1 long-chain acyl-CoA synthase, putative [Plasmodium berghei]SCN22282.1 long-chain acyl-CoA synthase, putative [Plasmodium berghei]|eukprot:XP_034420001.1 acyl-CoA synthetase, putative [Plasmodium berghei ANKA]
MNIHTLFGLIIYTLMASKYSCQEKNEDNILYAKVYTTSSAENESDVYKASDKPDPGYKHIIDLIMEIGESNYNMTTVIENAHGKHNEAYTYETMINNVNVFSYVLDSYDGGVPEKIYNEKENDGKFKLLGIYGNNSMNWLIADMAAMLSGVTTIVMHSRFSIDEVIDILNESQLEWLCLDLKNAQLILEKAENLPHLKKLIILDHIPIDDPKKLKELDKNSNNEKKSLKGSQKMDNSSPSTSEKVTHKELIEKDKQNLYDTYMNVSQIAKEKKIGIHPMEHILKQYSQNRTDKSHQNKSPNFISTIIYTSGTSGKPKGVMLSNKNIHNAITATDHLKIHDYFSAKVHFSYLPLSHVFERIVMYFCISRGILINIFSNNIKYFSDDLIGSKASIIVGVPKIFNKLYADIQKEINKLPLPKKFILKKALEIRRLNRHGKLDYLVETITGISKQIRNKINPSLKALVNGGGKLSEDVERELSLLLDVDIYQGFGMTETAGPIFMQRAQDKSVNSVGGPSIQHIEYKVTTWEAYDAGSKPPKGELLIKSDQLFRGYFLKNDLTKDSFTPDNYYKTGDVVQINKNGSITFLDRSKGLLKLSQGEYIETETLNNLYTKVPYINYCIAYADDTMDGPMAILSINKELFGEYLEKDDILKKLNITKQEFMENVFGDDINSKEYIDYVKKDMLEVYNKTNLSRHNLINDIYITTGVWDTSNYLTPTFKIRRFKLLKDYDFYLQKVKSKYLEKLKGQNTAAKN